MFPTSKLKRGALSLYGQSHWNGELLFNRYSISVLQEKSSGDWLHNNVNLLNSIDGTLKNS